MMEQREENEMIDLTDIEEMIDLTDIMEMQSELDAWLKDIQNGLEIPSVEGD